MQDSSYLFYIFPNYTHVIHPTARKHSKTSFLHTLGPRIKGSRPMNLAIQEDQSLAQVTNYTCNCRLTLHCLYLPWYSVDQCESVVGWEMSHEKPIQDCQINPCFLSHSEHQECSLSPAHTRMCNRLDCHFWNTTGQPRDCHICIITCWRGTNTTGYIDSNSRRMTYARPHTLFSPLYTSSYMYN